jgi:hypothetical protein
LRVNYRGYRTVTRLSSPRTRGSRCQHHG